METFLELFGLVLFILGVVALSAGITWAVVKLSPTKDKAEKRATTPAP